MNTSKAKKRRDAGIATAVLLAVALTLSACGTTKIDPISVENAGGNNTGEGDQLPSDNGIMEPGSPGSSNSADGEAANEGTQDGETGNQSSQGDPDTAVVVATGTFSGIIDNNSIEIITDAGADAYRITEELASVVNELPADAKVRFQYTVTPLEDDPSAHQNWLKAIEQITQ
ncbi:hypothetical protein ACX93W_10390 [Paenibacillus sp. CAU 1782]